MRQNKIKLIVELIRVIKQEKFSNFNLVLGMCSIEYTESMVSNGLVAFDLNAVNAAGNTITAQVLYFLLTLSLSTSSFMYLLKIFSQ